MQQSNNLNLFDKWVDWKDNSFATALDVNGRITLKHQKNTVTSTCISLGLRPGVDFQVTAYEVRFREKSFLAMFKMNFTNG